LRSSTDIKICVSSRPRNEFDQTLGLVPDNKIKLHEFTLEDIKTYIRLIHEKDARFIKLKDRDIRYMDPLVDIGDRAQGVFLWVFFVVRSLRQGFANHDTTAMLRVEEFPQDLEEYFKYMLDSVEYIYQR